MKLRNIDQQQPKIKKSKDPELLTKIKTYIQEQGIYKLSVTKLRHHLLLSDLDRAKVPGLTTL